MNYWPTNQGSCVALDKIGTGLLTAVLVFVLSEPSLAQTSPKPDDVVASTTETSLSLDEVLDAIRNTSGTRIPFREQQINPMLSAPLMTSGVLVYDPDDRSILKSVLEPSPLSYLMSDTEVVLSQNDKTRKISMKRALDLFAIFTSIRGVIEGSREDIDRFFEVNFYSEASAWNIELYPRENSLKEKLEVIEIWGIQSQVDTIVTRSSNGSVQTMWLSQQATAESGHE